MPAKEKPAEKKPAKKASPKKSKQKQIDGVRILTGSTDVLVVAPHGAVRKGKDGKPCYKNDERTGLIAEAIHKETGWYTIINDAFVKPGSGKDNGPDFSAKRLDLFKIEQAELVPGFLDSIKSAVDAGKKKTIVVWLHGIADKGAMAQMNGLIKAKAWRKEGGELHALIGYGQGKHPRLEDLEKPGSSTPKVELGSGS